MPTFVYTAKKIDGATVKGIMAAGDEASLIAGLRRDELYLISYKQRDEEDQNSRMKPKELSSFNRELGAMLSSGVTLIRSFEIMLKRDMPQKKKKVLSDVYRMLLDGYALSDAMEAGSGAFPSLLVSMFRAAEANGTMDLTATRMADHYEKESRLRNKIRSAMIYPIILLCLTVAVLIIIFTFVLNNFIGLYGDMELPTITKIIIGINTLLTKHYVEVMIVLAALIVGIALLLKVQKVRLFLDKLKLRLPVFGKLLRIIYTSRFSRTLSSLYSSGLTILTALQVSRGTLGNTYIASQFGDVILKVREGTALSTALGEVDGYDTKLSGTVMIGEETGKLESMLLSVSDSFDYEAEQATQRLVSMLEPLLIILMAVIIGGVMIGVMLPIYGMYNQISAM